MGYAIAQTPLAEMLRRTRAPFSVSEPAQIAAMTALGDRVFLQRTVRETDETRRILCAGLEKLGLNHIPSSTNFILVEVGDGTALSRQLESSALVVRPVTGYGLPGWVRITLGSANAIHRLLDALEAIY